MFRFSFRKAALHAFFGGLLFPVAAAAVEVTPLSEPVDPQPAADLINTSPAAEGFPFHNRLSVGPKQPSWNFTGLVGTATWNKYGLRPSAFAPTGNRSSDPAAHPVLHTQTSPRSSASRARTRAATPARTAAPKATAMPVKAAAAPKTVVVSVPVPPPPAAPKSATPEVYSAPAAPVAPPSPAIADAVPTPAPAPAPAIKAE